MSDTTTVIEKPNHVCDRRHLEEDKVNVNKRVDDVVISQRSQSHRIAYVIVLPVLRLVRRLFVPG